MSDNHTNNLVSRPRDRSRSGRNHGEDCFPTVRSTGDLSLALPRNMRDEILSDGQRSRSHSAPLTLEALSIAKELQRASDRFNTKYLQKKKEHLKDKKRRKTIAAYERASIQQEFDHRIWKEAGYDNVVSVEELRRSSQENILEIPEDGTPV